MAAKKGNKNAAGNRGGRKSVLEETTIAKFKGLVLDYAIKIMEHGTKAEKNLLVHRSINSVLPRPIEVGGKDGGEILIKVINYGNNTSSPQLSSQKISTSDFKSD